MPRRVYYTHLTIRSLTKLAGGTEYGVYIIVEQCETNTEKENDNHRSVANICVDIYCKSQHAYATEMCECVFVCVNLIFIIQTKQTPLCMHTSEHKQNS